MGQYAVEKLRFLQRKSPVIGSVRAIGLMIGIEIVDPVTGNPDGEALMSILDRCLEKGVLFYLCGNHGEVIRMIPPLTISKDEIDHGLKVLEEAVYEYQSSLLSKALQN
jgi:4-aminobutyrate aminotransferase